MTEHAVCLVCVCVASFVHMMLLEFIEVAACVSTCSVSVLRDVWAVVSGDHSVCTPVATTLRACVNTRISQVKW